MTPAEDPALAFARAYHAATLLIASTPALLTFAGWPLALPAHRVAAARHDDQGQRRSGAGAVAWGGA